MYYSLQIARALAALGVVLTHISEPISIEKYFGYSVVENYLSFGKYGVQFFFVLSGFIIYNVHKEHISKPSFLIEYINKRFRNFRSYYKFDYNVDNINYFAIMINICIKKPLILKLSHKRKI